MTADETLNEWELKRRRDTDLKSMTPHQQEAMLTMLKAWVPIRSRVSELISLDYDDLRAVDNAWWSLRHAFVDRDVEIKDWDM